MVGGIEPCAYGRRGGAHNQRCIIPNACRGTVYPPFSRKRFLKHLIGYHHRYSLPTRDSWFQDRTTVTSGYGKPKLQKNWASLQRESVLRSNTAIVSRIDGSTIGKLARFRGKLSMSKETLSPEPRQDASSAQACISGGKTQADDARCSARQGRTPTEAHSHWTEQAQGREKKSCSRRAYLVMHYLFGGATGSNATYLLT